MSRLKKLIQSGTALEITSEVVLTRGEMSRELDPERYTIALTQDRRRTMRWDGQLIVTLPFGDPLIPTASTDLLSNFGTQARCAVGVRDLDQSLHMVPWGHYWAEATGVTYSPAGVLVEIKLIDLAQRVALYRMESPLQVDPGQDLAAHVNAVIYDRTNNDPNLPPTGTVLTGRRTYGLDVETDPWRELVDLVRGFQHRLYYDANGELVLDREPTPDPQAAEPVPNYSNLQTAWETRPANVIVVRSEPEDPEEEPMQAVVMDDNPDSPTWAGNFPNESPYGRITRYYASPLLRTEDELIGAGQTILARSLALGSSYDLELGFDPLRYPDEMISVESGSASLSLEVDSVTIDLPNGLTSVAARTGVLPEGFE